MKNFKTLSKRGLALFLALMMCVSLLPATAMAAELNDLSADGRELICGKEAHSHTEECYETVSDLICGVEESHVHGEDCYVPGEPVLACASDEEGHVHTDACYVPGERVLRCGTAEDHVHSGDCYTESKSETLICALEEHEHSEECYAPAEQETEVPEIPEIVIPEGATLVDPAWLLAANPNAGKAMLSAWNLFGLVRDNYQDVLGGNFPETLTFVGETVNETVWYEDTQEYDPAVIRVTGDAIIYNGEPVTVYFQGMIEGVDEPELLGISGPQEVAVGDTITLESDKNWANGQWSATTNDGQVQFVGSTNGSRQVSVTGLKSGSVTITHKKNNIFSTTESKVITVVENEQPSYGMVDFKVYYIYSNEIPEQSTIYKDLGAAAFGPGGDDTALVTITVDIDALIKKFPNQKIVRSYVKDNTSYWYISAGTCGLTSSENAQWWSAVEECMTDDSKTALQNTEIGAIFQGYILKTQQDGGHCDGILTKKPPIYTVELYMDGQRIEVLTAFNENGTVDADTIKMDAIRKVYEDRVGGTFDWPNLIYEDAAGYYYVLTESNDPSQNTVNGDSIRYNQIYVGGKPQGYFVAAFKLSKGDPLKIMYTPTTLVVNKEDSQDPTIKLSNAEFTLYSDFNCHTVVETGVTNSDGVATISISAPGTYYLKETTAPSGYVLSDDIKEIVVSRLDEEPLVDASRKTVTYALAQPSPVTVANEPVPKYSVTYEWTGLPEPLPTLYNAGGEEETLTLPVDSNTYVKGESYLVDTVYPKGYVVYTHDAYGNKNGVYTFKGWDTEDGKITEDLTITGSWEYETVEVVKHTITINFVNDDAARTELQDPVVLRDIINNSPYDVTGGIPANIDVGTNHYIWESTNGVVMGTAIDDVVITVIYTSDNIGSDGTPDKYQATVTFTVVNGTWTGGGTTRSTVVTLRNAAGEMSADGTYTLRTGDIPTGTANAGYANGVWGSNANPNGTVIDRRGASFTLTYTPAGTTGPVFPPPDPGPGTDGGTTTIPENPTPLGPDPDGATTILDEEVPLANAVGLNITEHFAYIIGYEDDTVRPLKNITRAEAVTIFFRLMEDDYRAANWSMENPFSDVNAGNWHNNAVSTCLKAGALKHFAQDAAFLPNQAITRAEFASIAAGFVSDEITGESIGDFSDTEGHWAAADIRKAVEAGWIKGVGGNRFAPDETITRAEVMTIVNRMLDRVPDAEHMLPDMKKWLDNPEDAWYYEAVQEATNEHDYDVDEFGAESWTEILEARDWKSLENEWANNGGMSASAEPVKPEEGAEGEGEAEDAGSESEEA